MKIQHKLTILFGIILLTFILSYLTSADSSSSSQSLSEWRVYGRYVTNNMFYPHPISANISTLSVANYTMPGSVVTQVIIANGYAYFGSGTGNYLFQMNFSNLVQQIANYSTGTGNAVNYAPTIANGYAYFGAGNYLFQVNATNVAQQIANYSAGTTVMAPIVANDMVYFNAGTRIFGLNATNVAQQIANYTSANYLVETPAYSAGYVYITEGGTTYATRQLNASTLIQMTSRSSGGRYVDSPAVVAGDYVYACTTRFLMQLNATNISSGSISSYTFNPSSSYDCYLPPVIAAGSVYFASTNPAKIWQVNETNVSQLIGSYSVSAPYFKNLIVATNASVFLGGAEGVLYQFNQSNITNLIGKYNLGTSIVGPVIVNGRLFFSKQTNQLYEINATNDYIPSAPTITLTSPASSLFSQQSTHLFNATFVKNSAELVNATLYIWNSTNAIVNMTWFNITGVSNQTSVSVTLPYEDSFKWNYYSCDLLNNCGFSSLNRTLTYDNSSPQINIIYPQNTTYNSNVNSINYTYIDATSGSCWQSNSSGALNSSIVQSGINFTSLTSSEGQNIWTIYCNDSAGNFNSTNVYFVKETPSISLSLISPSTNSLQSQNQTSSISVNITCTNANCGAINLSLFSSSSASSGNLGDGTDGSLVIISSSTTINNYTHLNSNESLGDTTISINSTSGFLVGDEILIVQMQNYSGGSAGLYEFKTISSISGNDITLSTQLSNNYYSGVFNTTSATSTQIVRVPQYTNLTINSSASIIPAPWNGYSGGIVIFKATGTVNITGSINVSSAGYRGGRGANGVTFASGQQGESYTGLGLGPETSSSQDSTALWNANAGGGGAGGSTDNIGDNVGGGGGRGGYSANGTSCTYASYNTRCGDQGNTYGDSNMTYIFFGSGGGGGGTEEGVAAVAGAGGTGGGIIMIFANNLTLSGSILSNGENGYSYSGSEDGSGGGGAGGSIYLYINSVSLRTNLANASGGIGPNSGYGAPTNKGGNGANGRVRIYYSTISGTTSPSYTGSIGNFTLSSSGQSLISLTTGATPFYTTTQNPYNISLARGESQIITWTINATGATNSTYQLTAYASATEDSSLNSSTYFNITIVNYTLDNSPPTFTNLANQTLEYNHALKYDIDATDASGISCFSVNDISNFSINCSGYLQNILSLSVGEYILNISVNDTLGNTNYSIISINATPSESPNAILNSPSDNYHNDTAAYQNITFNCSATDSYNLKNISLFITNSSNLGFSRNQTTEINGTTNSSSWTLYLDSGTYTWNCLVFDSDSNYDWGENRTIIINLTDTDNDGIPNSLDKLEGNHTIINAPGISLLNVTVAGNSTNGTFNDVLDIVFYNNASRILNFTHNFTHSELDLSKITITKDTTYLIINLSGQLLPEYNKTVYLENNNFTKLCVKDENICSISEMSSSCSASGELNFDSCLTTNITINGISCTNDGRTIRIDNLKHSAIRGTPLIPTENQQQSSGSSSTSFGSSFECVKDISCKQGYVCYSHKCVKLFDIKILEVKSPLEQKEFFNFTYYMKGMAEIKGDVIVKFWLEKQGNKISEGQDTIYLGVLEEKTEKSSLFLPSTTDSGVYRFYVQVNYENYSAESYKDIEVIKTEKGIEFASPTDKQAITINLEKVIRPLIYFIIAILILFIIIRLLSLIKNIKLPSLTKKPTNSLTSHIGREVYTSNGNLIGKVKEIYIENYRICGWLIALDSKASKNLYTNSIMIKQSSIKSISEIIILDEKTSTYLEKFKD